MELIDVLIEAETQLDWGSDPSELQRALEHLVDVNPRDDLVTPLQLKLCQLRVARELGRVVQH